jgi:hypothetical protein
VLAAPAPAQQDLRSPDARDAALISQGLMEEPPETIVVTSRPAPGFDWLDAAIGAAFALGVGLLGAAAVVATRRRGREQPVVFS